MANNSLWTATETTHRPFYWQIGNYSCVSTASSLFPVFLLPHLLLLHHHLAAVDDLFCAMYTVNIFNMRGIAHSVVERLWGLAFCACVCVASSFCAFFAWLANANAKKGGVSGWILCSKDSCFPLPVGVLGLFFLDSSLINEFLFNYNLRKHSHQILNFF